MSSSRPVGRVWRGADAPRVTAASFAVPLPGAARGQGVTMADRIEEARAEGYQQGYAAASEELATTSEGDRQRRMAQVTSALVAAAERLAAERADAVSVAEVEVVALAVELAEAVVRRDLAMGHGAAADALRRAVSLVPAGEDLLVRLHPDEVVAPDELQAVVPESRIRVVADPEVEPGGCVVNAGPCHIDAQIGPALARARQFLAQLRPAGHETSWALPEGDEGQLVAGEPAPGDAAAGDAADVPEDADGVAADVATGDAATAAAPEVPDGADGAAADVPAEATADTDSADGVVAAPTGPAASDPPASQEAVA